MRHLVGRKVRRASGDEGDGRQRQPEQGRGEKKGAGEGKEEGKHKPR